MSRGTSPRSPVQAPLASRLGLFLAAFGAGAALSPALHAALGHDGVGAALGLLATLGALGATLAVGREPGAWPSPAGRRRAAVWGLRGLVILGLLLLVVVVYGDYIRALFGCGIPASMASCAPHEPCL